MSNLAAALSAAERGWFLFPTFYVLKDGACSCHKAGCVNQGKHPSTRNGVLDASSDPEQITRWWKAKPYANIGLATGHDGLVVLDVDCKPGQVGRESLAALVAKWGPLPETLHAKTGGGGIHYFFRSKSDIPNSTNKVGQNLDIRGRGGYVLLAPSNHIFGTKYEWLTPIDHPIADLPPWIEALAISKQQQTQIDVSGDSLQADIVSEVKEDKKKFKPLTKKQAEALLQYIDPDCPRNEWFKVGAALYKEIGDKVGFKVWNEWSAKSTKINPNTGKCNYDPSETARQWTSLKDEGITAGTLRWMATNNGFVDFNEAAIESGEFQQNWCYVTATETFVNMKRLIQWNKNQFNANFCRNFEKGVPSEILLRNPDFKLFDEPTFQPKQPREAVENGRPALNFWQDPGIEPTDGDVSMFIQHAEHILPDERERGILLDYLAYQVQQPGKKVHWAVLLHGNREGAGKSYFAHVMRSVLGHRNITLISNNTLHENFTQWQKNTQLVIVEEIMDEGKSELMNKLKPMITEKWTMVREMFHPPYEQVNRCNFLFFSNHIDSLKVTDNDRRYCIISSPAIEHEGGNKYYTDLFNWTETDEGASAILGYLLRRDLSDFQPKGRAPLTKGKIEAVWASMSPIDQYIMERVNSNEWPMGWDLQQPGLVVPALRTVGINSTPKMIAQSFTRLGYRNLARVRDGGGDSRVTVWAVRNFPTYNNMSPEQLRTLWNNQIAGGVNDSAAAAMSLESLKPINPIEKGREM